MPDIVVLGRARRADDAEVAALPVWFSSIDGFESRGSEAGGWFWPGGAPPETSLLHAVARRVLSVAQRPVPLQDLEAALTGARRFTAGVRRSARIEALPLLAVERLASRMHDLHVDAGRVAARVTLDAAVELPTPDRQIFEEALSHGGGLTMQTGAPRGWLDHRRWLAHLLPMVAHVGDFRTARASGQWACATASPTRRRAKG
ncbi:hypothetical protein [Paraburkholderia youngii]|uniref:hypothetical protein n=1 Tax=Paraburkholderia youngii TaxID=2782701 RepID=UPI003D1C460A